VQINGTVPRNAYQGEHPVRLRELMRLISDQIRQARGLADSLR